MKDQGVLTKCHLVDMRCSKFSQHFISSERFVCFEICHYNLSIVFKCEDLGGI